MKIGEGIGEIDLNEGVFFYICCPTNQATSLPCIGSVADIGPNYFAFAISRDKGIPVKANCTRTNPHQRTA